MGYIKELRKFVGSNPIIMIGACVILINTDQKILLQKRLDNGNWGLPSGSMEPGETIQETAKRELFEESGLISNSLILFDIFSGKDFYYKYPNGDEVYNVIVAFICSDFTGIIRKDDSEVIELDFFSKNDLPSNLNQSEGPIIQKYYDILSSNNNHL